MIRSFSCLTLAVTLSSHALAQHASDIELDLGPDGAIRTLAASKAGDPLPERVFASELGAEFPGFTDEPGFDSAPGTFPVPSAIGFTVRRALRAWVGGDFDAPAAERIEIAFGPLGPVATPISDEPVTGFTLPVGSNGQWHRHLEFTLTAPAGDGIYLLELELSSTDPGVLPSAPFWIVFNQNAPEAEHDAAIDWARENLVPSCRADFNADTRVNSQDFFDFLAAFFAENADFNGDGATNSQDLFDFLPVFFTGC